MQMHRYIQIPREQISRLVLDGLEQQYLVNLRSPADPIFLYIGANRNVYTVFLVEIYESRPCKVLSHEDLEALVV